MSLALTMPWYTKLIILAIDIVHNFVTPQSKNENDLTAHAAVEQKNLVQLQRLSSCELQENNGWVCR